MFWGSCSASLGAPCGTCPWEGDNGTPAHLTATREQGQEQRKQTQAVQGSIRTDVRNSFSLKEWPGSVRNCLWWGHHPWQCSKGIWMWHLGHGYGEIVVCWKVSAVGSVVCGSSAALSRLAWHSRVLSWHSRQCTPIPSWALLGGTAAAAAAAAGQAQHTVPDTSIPALLGVTNQHNGPDGSRPRWGFPPWKALVALGTR